MPLTPEQESIFREAWARGLTKEEIYPLIGMGVRPSAGQAGVPAGPAGPVMPAEPTWEEKGGLLGAAARAPVTKQGLWLLGQFDKFLFTPASTSVALQAQLMMPGEQNLEKQMRLGFQESKAEGESLFGQIGRAYQRGAEAKIAEVSLPFTIETPDWLVGEDKTIRDIDVGRLVAELPAEIAMGGIGGAAYRAVRPLGRLAKQIDPKTGRLAEFRQPREKPLPWEAKKPKRKRWLETKAEHRAREAAMSPVPLGPELPPIYGVEPADWYKAMTPDEIATSNKIQRAGQAAIDSAARQATEVASFTPASISGAAKRLMNDLNQIVIPKRARSYFTYLETLRDNIIRIQRLRLAPVTAQHAGQKLNASRLQKASQERLDALREEQKKILDKYPNRIVIDEGWTTAGPIDDLFPKGSPLFGKELNDTIIKPSGFSAPVKVRQSIVENAEKQSREMRILAQRNKALTSVERDVVGAKGKPTRLGEAKGIQAEIVALQAQILDIQSQAADLMKKYYISPEVLGGMTGADLIGALIKVRSKSPLVKLADLGKPEAAARATAEATTLRSIVQAGGIPTREAAIKAEEKQGRKMLAEVAEERKRKVAAAQQSADTNPLGRVETRARGEGLPPSHHSSESRPTGTPDVDPGRTLDTDIELEILGVTNINEFVRYARTAKPDKLVELSKWADQNLFGAKPPGKRWYDPKRITLSAMAAAMNLVDPASIKDSNAFFATVYTGMKFDTAYARSLQEIIDFRDSFDNVRNVAVTDSRFRRWTGRATNLEPLRWQAFLEHFPLAADDGRWGFRRSDAGEWLPINDHPYVAIGKEAGEKSYFGFDVMEAYWAHEHFGAIERAGRLGDSNKASQNFVKPRVVLKKGVGDERDVFDPNAGHGYTQYKKFFVEKAGGRALNYAEREAKFTQFFNETTAVGSAATEDFMKRLRVLLDEIEENIDPGAAATYADRPQWHRRVTQMASGEKPAGISSSNIQRVHAQGGDAVAAGVKYELDLVTQIIEMSTYGKKQVAGRDFADFALDPETGFGLALDALAGKVAAIKGQPYFATLNAGTTKLIDDMSSGLEKAKSAHAKFIANPPAKLKKKANETKTAFADRVREAADEKYTAAVHALNKDALERMGRSDNELLFPSEAFWASGQEVLKPIDIHRLFNRTIDTSTAPLLRHIGLEGRVSIVPESEIRQLEAGFQTIQTLVGKPALEGANIPQPGTGLFSSTTLSQLADYWRLTATGFDHAFPMTVGLPLLFRSPAAWAQTFRIQLEAFVDPNWLSNVAKRDPNFLEGLKKLVRRGIATSDPEQFRGMKRLEDGDVEAYVTHLTREEIPLPPIDFTSFSGGAKAVALRVAKWTGLRRFQRGYGAASLATKVMWQDILEPSFTRVDGTIDEIGIRSQIQNVTGSPNPASLGVSTNRRQLENFWLGLSPRLTKAVAALVFDAQRGVKNIAARNIDFQYALTQGQRGRSPWVMMEERLGRALNPAEDVAASAYNKQALSLGNLGTALFASSATFFLFSYAYGRASEKSHEEALQEAFASVDPAQGKKHLAIDIDGSWVGIGGFWRSLAQLNYKLVWSAAEAAKGNLGPMRDWFSYDQFDNPIISTIKNRGAPGFNFGGLVVERITGRDAAPYDVVDSNWDLVLNGGEEFLPFIAQGLVEGENAASALFGMFGARTSSLTLGDATVFEAREKLGLEVDGSRDIAESWIKSDVLYPFVQETRQMSAKASNSPLGRWMERRKVLSAEFETLLEREYRGGISDYDLIRLYYEERGKMYARLDELKKQVGMGDFDINPNDPIAVALKKWRDVYQKEDVITALKDQRYDIIDAHRAKLFKDFTKEQQDAVLREGSGIHREIAALLNPESQERYAELYNRRVAWIKENIKTPEDANELIQMLRTSMFPTLGEGIPRGIVTGTGRRTDRETEIRIPVRPL